VLASANIGERRSVRRYSPLVSGTLGLSYSTSHAMEANTLLSLVQARESATRLGRLGTEAGS
jgi:hypothetical protein